MTWEVGTSGWQYKDWRERYYPTSIKQSDWLGFYAEDFTVVEINNSFYRLPTKEQFAKWFSAVPDTFGFVPKMSRYLSHVKRLRDPAEPIERFLTAAEGLGKKLRAVLIQLPPNLKVDLDSLQEVAELWPSEVPLAIEFREPSWFVPETKHILTRYNIALCLADRKSKSLAPLWKTADWGYLRMHEGRSTPFPCYGNQALDSWGKRLTDAFGTDGDGFIFFNNDPGACAIKNAHYFREMISQRVTAYG